MSQCWHRAGQARPWHSHREHCSTHSPDLPVCISSWEGKVWIGTAAPGPPTAPSRPCRERRDRHGNVWAQPTERTRWEQPVLKGSWNIPDLDLLSALGLRVWQKGITRLWPCPLLTAALTNTSQGLTQSLFKGNTIFPHKTFFKVYLNLLFSVTASLGNKHIKPLMICISKERHYSAIINTNRFKILPIFGEELQHSCKQNL